MEPALVRSSHSVRRVTKRRLLFAACGLLGTVGCALLNPGGSKSNDPPKPATVRFYLASTEQRAEYHADTDEAGQPLYIAPAPFLTELDIRRASMFDSRKRSLVQLEFGGFAAVRLEQLTRENVGSRLAVYLDDHLIMSPRFRVPIAGGKVYLDGDFTKAQAEELVRRLTPMPTTAPSSEFIIR